MQKLKVENRKKAERKKKSKYSNEEKQMSNEEISAVKSYNNSTAKKTIKLQKGKICLELNKI